MHSPHNYMVLFPEDEDDDDDDETTCMVEKGKSELIGRMSTVCMCKKSPWDVILVLFAGCLSDKVSVVAS